ncbi:MAG: hypothetical protein Q8P81_02100 [Nanoarchaeota archaeon]|nr:hypothetical protein [Nanoarchaeota archaeon]
MDDEEKKIPTVGNPSGTASATDQPQEEFEETHWLEHWTLGQRKKGQSFLGNIKEDVVETSKNPLGLVSAYNWVTGNSPEDKKKQLEEQGKINEQRSFNLQCFLVDNMQEFADRRKKDREEVGSSYKSFAMISGGPGDICQELLSSKGVEQFINLTSAQRSLLMPKINIYKVVYGGPGNPKGGKDIRLVFKDHTSDKDIQNITKSKLGRGDDVAIKSFSYEMTGKNVEQGGLMKCSLVLFFSNATSFLDKRDNGISFSDLIWDKKSVSASGESYSSKNFNTKIIVGWSVPSDPKGVLFSSELIKTINRTSTVLFVSHSDHDIDFREDGTLQVTINFTGAIEGIVDDKERANIFNKTKRGNEAVDRKNKLSASEAQEKEKSNGKIDDSPVTEKRCEVKWKLNNINKEGPLLDSECSDVAVAPNAREIERKNIKELEALDKQEKYSRLIRLMNDKNQMYYVDIDPLLLNTFSKEEEEKIKEDLEQAKKSSSEKDIRKVELDKQSANRRISGIGSKIKRVLYGEDDTYASNRQTLFENSVKEINKTTESIDPKTMTAVSTKKTEEEKKKIMTSALTEPASAPVSCADCMRAYFFYFGDLLDILFENFIFSRDDVEDLQILIGQLIYKDPRTEQQMEINIADIPISMERFLAWYSKKIIATQSEVYTVGQVIKDIIGDVIAGSLGETCFGVTNNTPNIVFTNFSIPRMGNDDQLIQFKSGERYSVKDLKGNPKSDVFPKSDDMDVSKLKHFLFVYADNYKLSAQDGDYKKDMARGVYHLAPGLDRGLVKGIKFTKMAIPYKAQEIVSGQSTETGVSPNLYNATVRMVGNNLFRNGVFIYIDTAKMGMGYAIKPGTDNQNRETEMLSFAYHIGGYYHVLKVTFEFSGGGDYETILEAQWTNAKIGKATGFSVQNNETCTSERISYFNPNAPNQSIMKK